MRAVFFFTVACYMLLHTGAVWASPLQPIVPDRPNVSQQEPRISIVLQRVYLDGEVSEEVLTEEVGKLERLLRQYRDWQMVDRDETEIVLQRRIQDISPLLKTSGYFGVSKEGILQIFKGMPNEENVIHSFFQINTKKLKVDRRLQLEQGIRVQSKEQFAELLQEMRNYANH